MEVDSSPTIVYDVPSSKQPIDDFEQLLIAAAAAAEAAEPVEEQTPVVVEAPLIDTDQLLMVRLRLTAQSCGQQQPSVVFLENPGFTDLIVERATIGSGGFGRVHRHVGFVGDGCGASPMAVKLIGSRDGTSRRPSPATLQGIRAESYAMWLVGHPNIVETVGVGWLLPEDNPGGDDGDGLLSTSTIQLTGVVVMEFVEGRTLHSIIRDGRETIDFERRVR